MINEDLMKILACPKCRGSLRLSKDKSTIICDSCRLSYPINNDTPVLLIDSATPIKDGDNI